MAPASAKPTTITIRIASYVLDFVDDHNLGYVTGADGGFELAPNIVLVPDCAFVSKTRQPELPERFFKIAPDLAIEVISPTDSVKAAQRKARRCLSFGTQMVWQLYPEDRTVEVYRPDDGHSVNVQELSEDEGLDGGDVLPGFSLKVSVIFGK